MVHFISKMKTKSKLYISYVCIRWHVLYLYVSSMFVYKIFTSISELLLYIYVWLDKV